ncbi:hypothetical protein BG000_001774, partial [Podila horticola]
MAKKSASKKTAVPKAVPAVDVPDIVAATVSKLNLPIHFIENAATAPTMRVPAPSATVQVPVASASVHFPITSSAVQISTESAAVKAHTGSVTALVPADSVTVQASTASSLANATSTSGKKRKNAEKIKVTTETSTPSTSTPAKKYKSAETKGKSKAFGPSTTTLATMKPTGDKNSNQAIEEPKSGIRNSAESPYTPLPTPSAKASTSAAKPKNPDVPYSSTRQERMRRKNAPNMPHPLSYTKRPDYRRLQHELKLHKVKHGYIQIAALTPQPPAMTQLKRYLERTQARTVFRFLSKYKTETAKQRIARKEAEASNAASEKKTVPLLEETNLNGRQDGDGEGDGTVIKKEVE